MSMTMQVPQLSQYLNFFLRNSDELKMLQKSKLHTFFVQAGPIVLGRELLKVDSVT